MKMICGCLLVLTGSALLAGQMLPDAQTAVVRALAQATAPDVQDGQTIAQSEAEVVEPAERTGAPQVALQFPVSPATAVVSLDSSPPENAQPHGQDSSNAAVWIDVMRENERRQTLLELLKRLLAQRAVLTAERDVTGPVAPKKLVDLVGARASKTLVAAQAKARSAARAEIEAQDAALGATIASVKRELAALADRMAQIDINRRNKADRLNLLQTASKGVIAGTVMTDARVALAEVEERRQDTVVLIAQTEQRLAQAEHERAKLARHARAELERELLAIEAQITDAEISLATSQGILTVMRKGTSSAPVRANARKAPAGRIDL